jgi:putative superfamily III holin-X
VTHRADPLEPAAQLSTSELVRQALDESRELVRLEMRLAREELRDDVRKLKWAGILVALAGAMFIVALAMFDLAVVLALGGTANIALIIAFIVLGEVAVLALVGYRLLPKVPMERTRARLATDVHALKEQVTH